jgi:dihydrofolate reductase
MNEIPKAVFSDSLASADWGETTIAAGDLAEAITRLKRERSDGYLLAHGGARFARSLVETGLIDEYRLLIVSPSRASARRADTETMRQFERQSQSVTDVLYAYVYGHVCTTWRDKP